MIPPHLIEIYFMVTHVSLYECSDYEKNSSKVTTSETTNTPVPLIPSFQNTYKNAIKLLKIFNFS